MKKTIPFLVVLVFLFACHQDKTYDNANTNFFPIAGNINAELNELDSLPVGINKYVTAGDKTDTLVATKEELKTAALDMTTPDISSDTWKKYYKETVFYDKSLDYLTMSYDTESGKPEIRKIDVVIKQETSKLRSVYVEKRISRNDSTLLKKMVWTPGKSLQVISINGYAGKEETRTVKYAWGME